MARTKDEILRNIDWQKQQLNIAWNQHQDSLQKARSRIIDVWALSMFEEGEERVYERIKQDINAKIKKLEGDLLLEEKYSELLKQKNSTRTESEFRILAEQFGKLNFEDSQQLANECDKQYHILKQHSRKQEQDLEYLDPEKKYSELLKRKNSTQSENVFRILAKQFRRLNFEDSQQLAIECDEQYHTLKQQRHKKQEQNLEEHRKDIAKFQGCISLSGFHTVGLKADGKVVAVGNDDKGQCNMGSWRKIIAVSTDGGHTVGLKADGKVVSVGYNKGGQGKFRNIVIDKHKYGRQCNTGNWREIIAIFASAYHTVGLKVDGTVIAVGNNEHGQCNTKDWKNIIAVSASTDHTVGLKADGTVVAVGSNYNGQCNTRSWREIISISTGSSRTVGLKVDGTVIAVGKNEHRQCNTEGWENIVAISADSDHTVGLKADGTVMAVGNNESEKCNTEDWKDIIAISADSYHTVGLKADGTVIATGSNHFGQCNTGSWRNIVAISTNWRQTAGLKANGTVVAVGDNGAGQCNTKGWQNIGPVPEEHILKWKGLCQYCGGRIGGFFSKKCKSCGQKN